MTPQRNYVEDDRIDSLIDSLRVMVPEGWANHVIFREELLALCQEVKRNRDKPLHCPGCDGDHL